MGDIRFLWSENLLIERNKLTVNKLTMSISTACHYATHSLWTTEPNRVVKFKKKIFSFFLLKITITIWGKVILGRNRLEQAILGPLWAPKLPKMAILGSFRQFDAY